jgi:hypothetical protein
MSVETRSGIQRQDVRRQLATPGKRPSIESTLLASPWKRNSVICLLLAAATLALYSPAIAHPFIPEYDDDCYVIDNPHAQSGVVWKTVTWAVTSKRCGNWHPVTWLSHAVDCELYGLNPHGHHVTNVLLHALNVVLLFLLLARATGAVGRSALVAALFAGHPLNVESVVWIAERKNVLSTLFFLLALGAYGWYARKPTVKRYGVVALLFVLGLASKPMVITLPCVLLLLDFWPLRRIQGWGPQSPEKLDGGKVDKDKGGPLIPLSPEKTAFSVPQVRLSRLVLEKLPLFALSVASSVMTVFAQRSHGFTHPEMPRSVRLGNAVYAYAMYVWKTFWPVRLAVFYPHPWATLAVWQLAPAALFLLLVSVLVWQQRRPRPYLLTSWLWYLGTLVPVIGLVQVGEQAMADRYAYIPLIGIFLMAVWGAADLADAMQLGFRSRATAAAVVLLVLAIFTSAQIRYWRSSYDLWSHTIDVTKDNFIGEEFLGDALLASDRAAEALPHLQKAARIRPLSSTAHLSLGGILAVSGRSQDAIIEYETAMPRISDPKERVVPYEILGRLYSEVGNYSKARASYEQALRINPQQVTARDELARLELPDALDNAAESRSDESYLQLGELFQQAGRVPEALAAYRQALRLNPRLAEAQKGLAALNKRIE